MTADDSSLQMPAQQHTGPISDVDVPRIFSLEGRLGRIRYFAYLSLWTWSGLVWGGMVFWLLTGISLNVLSGNRTLEIWLRILLIYCPLLFGSGVLARRRFHDINQSGWLCLLVVVPCLNFFTFLYLVSAPGTDGRNNYGQPTVKNSVALIWLGVVLPLVLSVILSVMICVMMFSAMSAAYGGR